MRWKPSAFFDGSGTVRRPDHRRLLGEAGSFLTYFPRMPEPIAAPAAGHVVLVVPAFLTTDAFTRPLRDFLRRCGYRAFGWDLGINLGPTPRLLAGLRRRLDELCRLEGGPISVIGVSLGGLLARDVAFDHPSQVRHVITVVSPFRLPTATTIEPLFHLLAPLFSEDLLPERLKLPLPVPATAIYTRDDGLVAWESCMGKDEGCIDIAVSGSHVTVCRNPAVLTAVGQRLAEELTGAGRQGAAGLAPSGIPPYSGASNSH